MFVILCKKHKMNSVLTSEEIQGGQFFLGVLFWKNAKSSEARGASEDKEIVLRAEYPGLGDFPIFGIRVFHLKFSFEGSFLLLKHLLMIAGQ